MHTRRMQAGALTLIAGLALMGCGSSSKHLTKSQYAARANAICQQATSTTATAHATIDKLPPPKPGSHVTATQFNQAAQAERTESAATMSAATKIRALGTPATEANLASNVPSGIAAVGTDEAALARAAQTHNIHAVATAFAGLRAHANQLAPTLTQLGLTACTQI